MPMLDRDSLWLHQKYHAYQETSRVSLALEQLARTQNILEIRKDHEASDKIKAAMLSNGNPVAAEGDKLYNIITLAYVPQEYVPLILNNDDAGQKLYEGIMSEQINGEISRWGPFKHENNKIFTSGNKKSAVRLVETKL